MSRSTNEWRIAVDGLAEAARRRADLLNPFDRTQFFTALIAALNVELACESTETASQKPGIDQPGNST